MKKFLYWSGAMLFLLISDLVALVYTLTGTPEEQRGFVLFDESILWSIPLFAALFFVFYHLYLDTRFLQRELYNTEIQPKVEQ